MSFDEHDGRFCGFVDASIREVYESCPEFFESLDLLVTCLAHSTNVARLAKWMTYVQERRFRHRPIGASVWIARAHVAEIFADEQTFRGFDEIYLLNGFPHAADVPADRFTTDAVRFAGTVPSTFQKGLVRLKAARFLADGTGLNFVCESEELATLVTDAFDDEE
ncbi:MAG: hypothetical protein HYR85_10315 [Planctomycetes bacterium]|nr:hypothetical protein [Planctomycetota bacterium]MBI3847142.1 hypothetical protein [Planctomycetota bacterium]